MNPIQEAIEKKLLEKRTSLAITEERGEVTSRYGHLGTMSYLSYKAGIEGDIMPEIDKWRNNIQRYNQQYQNGIEERISIIRRCIIYS